MTTRTMQSRSVPDAATAEASSSGSWAAHASAQGELLRFLLAGAVALLVMLLPGQLAASRDQIGALSQYVLDRQPGGVGWPAP